MAQNSTNTKLVDAAGTNRGKIGVNGDLSVSMTNPTASALGIFAALNPYGAQRVSVEPTVLLYDAFDFGSLNTGTTGKWNTGGNTVPTVTNGVVNLAPPVGASVSNSSILTSVPNFVPPGLGFLITAGLMQLENTQTNAVNVHRFFGRGTAAAPTYAVPLDNGVGFEVDGATGALQCVVYVNQVKYVINSTTPANISSSVTGAGGAGTALPAGSTGTNYGAALTWRANMRRYAVFTRADAAYWYIEGQDAPVAAVSYVILQQQWLPLRVQSITNPAGTSLANTFTLSAVGVSDSTAQNYTLSDPDYPHRRAAIDSGGRQLIRDIGWNTPGPASITAAAADTLILAANSDTRRGVTVYNDSTATLYLSFGNNAASTTAFSVKIAPSGYYETPFGFTGQIRGIWSAANGAARVTEFTT